MHAKTPRDSRAYPRFNVRAFADVTGTDVLLYQHVEDLSLGGLRVQGGTPDDVGSKVDVVLNFPELDTELAVTGRVTWAKSNAPRDMGIRFDLDEVDRARLEGYLEVINAA
jgi:Tfp pilus assembly protein PilZ